MFHVWKTPIAVSLIILPNLAWSQAPPKADIFIAATGGTIASAAGTIGGINSGSVNPDSYTAGKVGINNLISAVPQLKTIANVTGDQVLNIPSQNFTDSDWVKLAKRLQQAENSKNVAGIVVTIGTDNLASTAFFVMLTVKTTKPIIFTGAMRPATWLSADGPMNLYNSVAVAASPKAKFCGVVAVLNDQVDAARDVYKTNTTMLNTFQSVDQGPVGKVENGVVDIFNGCSGTAYSAPKLSIDSITTLPKVDIIYAYAGMGRGLIDAAVAGGAKGLIIAGVGDGNVDVDAMAGMQDASKKGVVIVRSTKVQSGFTVRNAEVNDTVNGFVASGEFKPSHARALLQVALLRSDSVTTIQKDFDTW